MLSLQHSLHHYYAIYNIVLRMCRCYDGFAILNGERVLLANVRSASIWQKIQVAFRIYVLALCGELEDFELEENSWLRIQIRWTTYIYTYAKNENSYSPPEVCMEHNRAAQHPRNECFSTAYKANNWLNTIGRVLIA